MCVFCEIIKGNIPSYKVYEDDRFVAFLDISQATIGHTLVVPKNHYPNILELEDDDIMAVVKKVATMLKKALGVEDFNILNNCGKMAGQTVNHFHIHIIPRYENDSMIIEFSSNKLENDDFIRLLEKIRKL